MYKITRAYRDPVAGIREAAVIPLTDIKRGLYLYPVFGSVVPQGWTSGNVLEKCKAFSVAPFASNYIYATA